MTDTLDKLRAIGECAWYQDVDEFTHERVWVTDCFGSVDPALSTVMQACIEEADLQFCPLCGKYISETTKADYEADKRGDAEYREGIRYGTMGYGG